MPRCLDDSCDMEHCAHCGGHTVGNQLIAGMCQDCFDFQETKETKQVWTVATMVSDQGVGITGVFSSKEKAEKAAREEMDAIVDACALMEPSLSKTWYGVEMEHGGRIYSNAHWDVVVTPWILDSKEFFQGGIRPFRS